jgi:hypothetical protein
MALLDVHPLAGSVAQLLLQALIGLEANSLRRWTLARHGRPAVDVVTGADRDEAEAKAFARWLDARPTQFTRHPASAAPLASPRRSEPVIGLFPDAERTR